MRLVDCWAHAIHIMRDRRSTPSLDGQVGIARRGQAAYSLGLMRKGAAEAPFPHRHLLGIEGLSPDDINKFLDLADGYVELNRQAEKKRSLLRGRTIINCFFESSTRTAPRSRTPASLGRERKPRAGEAVPAGMMLPWERRR